MITMTEYLKDKYLFYD